MKKYIITALLVILILVGTIYMAFAKTNSASVTYIRYKVNPEFILGVNNNDEIVFYNPLNDEAREFNLLMFKGKNIEEATKIFYEKSFKKGYIKENNINITIITMNDEKRTRLFNKIDETIKLYQDTIKVNLIEPTSDELLAYSNETFYNQKPTFNNDDLINISNELEKRISKYVDEKCKNLKNDDIKGKNNKGYFNDFDLISQIIDYYDINILPTSYYKVDFSFEEQNYTYKITLNIDLKYFNIETNDNERNAIVEVYNYKYENKQISNYNDNFYRFTYEDSSEN